MTAEKYIVLLDPSIRDNEHRPSDNLGDIIIYDSVRSVLDELFPGEEVIRISTHQYLTKKEKQLINSARLSFVGGTNLLSSDIRHFPRLSPEKRKGFYFFPGFKNVILLGVGWSAYQQPMDWASKIYYKNILRKGIQHSVRDIYSMEQMNRSGFRNMLHTSCPSTWQIDTKFVNEFNPNYKKVLLMLTNYAANEEADNKLIELILNTGDPEIYFFPQSSGDTDYLKILAAYKKNSSRFTILGHDLADFYRLLSSVNLNYIGNRLHGGIKCLSQGHPSMIIGIDNRAIEMGKSINLNVVDRNDTENLRRWLQNDGPTAAIKLPIEEIKSWKKQFMN
jgi:hypothetical protein